ncbi:helix-turn-helix transcriptional regulator [Photorhabdus tasmaniensis]|uniref:Helix-turn-helix transcriptional regulator n=1 Tax=Photorhabdus tasmaniensis TaxID=1004159 RepID=A0ABX0GFR0_9GAMM|nr:PAS and helix-turn-helix domain-containing protein [Photorhabdus tasmaniensis]NHB87141.1 helix-turn-helix transcriptional regulator [Photorhabdus tasmaniensis]
MKKFGCKKVPFITTQLTNTWDRSTESWFIKDKEFRFIYANAISIKANKLPEKFNIIGYTDKELPTPFNHFANLFEEHDRKVLECMQRISSISTYPQGNGQQLKSYFCNKYLLMDEDNQCIRIIFHAKEIDHFAVSHYMMNNTSMSIRLRPPNNILTQKEWTIIFLFCRGIHNKCIADEMKISFHTVERYFESIYNKLSISSSIELRLFCKENDYDIYIPPRYFQPIGHFLL